MFAALGDQEKKEVHFSEAAKDSIGGKENDEEQQNSNDKDDSKGSNSEGGKGAKADKEENSSVSTTSPKRKTTGQVGKREPKKKIERKPRAEEKVEVFIDDLQALPHVLRMDSDSEGRADSFRLSRLDSAWISRLPEIIIIIIFLYLGAVRKPRGAKRSATTAWPLKKDVFCYVSLL